MKKSKFAVGILILAFVFLAAGAGMLYSDFHNKNQEKRQYESLAEIARESTEEENVTESSDATGESEASYVSPIQFDKLRAINPDIVGWIRIDGTSIDYPIVQTDNNETYLDTDFEGKKNASGAIYLDYESEPDFSSRHNLLYGHHMKNGTMFKDIVKYKDETFYKEHQKITIYTPEREYDLRPISVLYTDASGERRKTRFDSEESFKAYVDEMTKNGLFYQKPESSMESLWSFVTCSYEFPDARTILYACEVPQVEK
jgi:sortase B